MIIEIYIPNIAYWSNFLSGNANYDMDILPYVAKTFDLIPVYNTYILRLKAQTNLYLPSSRV